jgi:AcrR family transcriptional regulator
MAAIAAEAGVSKALLHYHYSDRARLLAEVVDQLGRRIIGRERSAMDRAQGSGAVDALWSWLDDELARGELRALLELALEHEPEVRAASTAAFRAREQAAARTVEQLFAGLGLTPRMPAALLAGASLAFVDGLAIGLSSPNRDPRASFDLFWLALLSLAE